MTKEETVALECPYCRNTIHRPLSWFKQPYFTCPACAGGLTENQFAPIVRDLEQAFEQTIDEMVHPKPACGCCHRKAE
ncbi:MAG: hypothetical protein SCI25_12445 [Desulfuromonadales bacterium]|nr:hypothetical protein [Desulfuromonadales bacterium]MDW7757590.1 hypothetical protein [Desulfuromonadales bacterium]